MEGVNGYFITFLLSMLNILIAVVLKNLGDIKKDLKEEISDVREFTRGTRRKLDIHVENYQLHRTS